LIIVAVAIAISIAVAGWLMGLWGGFGQTESLKVFPDSYVETTDRNGNGTLDLVLHIQNVGGAPAQIYRIEISGQPLDLAGAQTTNAQVTGGTIVLDPGVEDTIYIPLPTGFTPAAGVAYTVTIYTEAGNVYTTTVYGK